MEIFNGAEPTATEKLLLVEKRNRLMKLKAIEDAKKKAEEERYSKLQKDLEESKTNKNKRRNLRKKLRR